MKPIDWTQSQIKTSDLLKYFADQLSVARENNDSPGNSVEQTGALRGRIALLKELIRLPESQVTLSEIESLQ